MGEWLPGSVGVQDSSFCAKGHPTRIKLQKKPRDGEEHREGEAEAHMAGRKIT